MILKYHKHIYYFRDKTFRTWNSGFFFNLFASTTHSVTDNTISHDMPQNILIYILNTIDNQKCSYGIGEYV